MKIYGFLLEDLTFKPNKTPRDFINYILANDESLPIQAEADTDVNDDNPYFGITPVFTRNSCDFETIEDAERFLIQTIQPFVDMDENEIKSNLDFIDIAKED